MSPNGLVKVARAGPTTSASAVWRTLWEVAATGKATTKNTLPMAVARKQSGRTMMASVTTMTGSLVVAKAEVLLAIPMSSAQTVVISLVFICVLIAQNSR